MQRSIDSQFFQPHYFGLILLSGFLLSLFFAAILKRFSLRFNILTCRGIPLVGGIAIIMSFIPVLLLSSFFCHSLSKEIVGIILSSAVMFAFELIDDWRELSVMAKLVVQIIAAAFLIIFGIRTQIVYIGNTANIIITFIWIIGIANAFNHLDIMDGLAGGTAASISLGLFVIAVLNADVKSAILSLALSGAILGFLFHNLPPAKVYMGNSGSHFLGFVLAAIALLISYAPLERKIALFSPLIILGLPIFDTAFLIFIRMSKNKLPFKKSNDHLALRFLALNYSKRKTLTIMLAWCLFFCLCGVIVSRAANFLGIWVIFIAVLAGLVLMKESKKIVIDG